ncbi:proline-rich receptor-like protein kinase PERK2 [Photinus pyralis]|uniref:proline-rich receptor-like protein kinase PERK2 n=1 Tax=Photinus pyralis TaxID=7054 RepID=UPI0012670F19|nr:proline-rich receptor-like protein kinase PERK2 [Photinus pyralis]
MSHLWVLCLLLTGVCAFTYDVQQKLNSCINNCLQSLPTQDCGTCVQPPPSPPPPPGCYCPNSQPTGWCCVPPPLNPGWIPRPGIQPPFLWPGIPNQPPPVEPEQPELEPNQSTETPVTPSIQQPPPIRPWIPNYPIPNYPPVYPNPNFPPYPYNPHLPETNRPIPNFPTWPNNPGPGFPPQQCCSNSQAIQGCVICFPYRPPPLSPVGCNPLCFGNVQCCNSWDGTIRREAKTAGNE